MNVKLNNAEKIKLISSSDVYAVMERIFKRESKVDRKKEHFWTISLDNACRIVNIELVSLGTVNATLVEPMEVYSIPLQKKAVSIVLVHNHPSGQLKPSEKDQDLTDRLIQCGMILGIRLTDHLIITENSYYSFADSELLEKLKQSTKYTPTFYIREKYEKQMKKVIAETQKETRKKNIEQIAKKALKKDYPVSAIAELTGLSEKEIEALKPKKKSSRIA